MPSKSNPIHHEQCAFVADLAVALESPERTRLSWKLMHARTHEHQWRMGRRRSLYTPRADANRVLFPAIPAAPQIPLIPVAGLRVEPSCRHSPKRNGHRWDYLPSGPPQKIQQRQIHQRKPLGIASIISDLASSFLLFMNQFYTCKKRLSSKKLRF